ncbi:MAG: hypothetical protein K7J15_00725, partial [Candidatus Regiella insecticola]|nr:hypothetical protein [Candidatus Regiella insecticola]
MESRPGYSASFYYQTSSRPINFAPDRKYESGERLATFNDFDDGTIPRVGHTDFEYYLMGIEKMPIERLFESRIPIQTKQLRDEI